VCQSLFEKDKLLFAFLLTSRLLLGGSDAIKGAMTAEELRFLLTGGVAMQNPHDNPAPDWLSDKAWGELCRLDALPGFAELREFVTLAPEVFQPLFAASDPVQERLPEPWHQKLSPFQRILVLRALRPDKILPALQQCAPLPTCQPFDDCLWLTGGATVQRYVCGDHAALCGGTRRHTRRS
jgi:dynein heavy chain